MNKKTKIAIIGVIALVLVTAGITYAYWLITRTQQGENAITTGCLDITLSGSGDITLTDQFPLSDEDGMELTPYTFTVTNNCNTSVEYQIALEALEAGDEIASSAIKVALGDKVKLYSEYSEVDATAPESYEARRVGFATLGPKGDEGATATHELRIWIDENASIDEMNKTFKSKITVTVGQGISSFSLYSKILADNGGTDKIETVENVYVESSTFEKGSSKTIYEDEYEVYNGTWGTSYTLNQSTGQFSLEGTIVNKTILECKTDGGCGEYIKIGNNMCKVDSFTNSKDTPGDDLMLATYYIDLKCISSIGSFSKGPEIDESALYKMDDDLGSSYYYRGNVQNNYVKLGTWQEDVGTLWLYKNAEKKYQFPDMDSCLEERDFYNEIEETQAYECKTAADIGAEGMPMYWRIVRINGDGSIRLIYDGTSAVMNGVEHNTQIKAYESNNTSTDEDPKQVGYMYGTNADPYINTNESAAKMALEKWYETNLYNNYHDIMADGIYCNDRQEFSNIVTDESWRVIDYAGYNRINTNNPSLKCTRDLDKFSYGNLGNGKLDYPIGLLTADELFLAGSNENSFLYTGLAWLTMTPSRSHTMSGSAVYYFKGGLVNLGGVSLNQTDFGINEYYNTLRPVINIKKNTKFIGNGTVDSPYELLES